MKRLSEREQKVTTLKFNGYTLAEIGTIFNVTPSRVRNIWEKARDKMKSDPDLKPKKCEWCGKFCFPDKIFVGEVSKKQFGFCSKKCKDSWIGYDPYEYRALSKGQSVSNADGDAYVDDGSYQQVAKRIMDR